MLLLLVGFSVYLFLCRLILFYFSCAKKKTYSFEMGISLFHSFQHLISIALFPIYLFFFLLFLYSSLVNRKRIQKSIWPHWKWYNFLPIISDGYWYSDWYIFGFGTMFRYFSSSVHFVYRILFWSPIYQWWLVKRFQWR